MYDELVKRLRHSANLAERGLTMPPSGLREASDAIEDLSKRIDRAIELYNRNVEKTAINEVLMGISPEPPKEE